MGPFTTLRGLNGSSTSKGNAVDNAGRVVGQAWVDADGVTQHAFKSSNGSLTDLDGFGSSLSSADGIADGTTVGYFTLADGVSTHAFVHTDADGTVDLEHAYSERLRLDAARRHTESARRAGLSVRAS